MRAESQSSRRATSRIVSPERRALAGKCHPPASGVRTHTVSSPKNGITIASWADAGGNSLKVESRRETNVRFAIELKSKQDSERHVNSPEDAVRDADSRCYILCHARKRSATRNGSLAMTDAA